VSDERAERDALDAVDAVFADHALAARVERDRPIGPLTTYRVGGAAARFLEVESIDDLVAVARAHRRSGLPVLVVGRGSNLLVADAGFRGIAIRLGGAFTDVEIDTARAVVRCGGAASLPVVARRTAAAGLTGFEWAVGVPGSIGGAVRMNAGGHGSDLAAALVEVTVVDLAAGDGAPVTRPAAALQLAYRHSTLRDDEVVVAAALRLAAGDATRGLAVIEDIVRWRRDNQPGGQNAGSVFTNPPGDSAGRLIDAAGAKGMRVGSACVSPKHANFFQADERGSADDIRALMIAVRRRVHEVHGIWLVPETRMIGYPHDEPAAEQAGNGQAGNGQAGNGQAGNDR
jgi:UDP-N-acetylmuramate dehydrogenase